MARRGRARWLLVCAAGVLAAGCAGPLASRGDPDPGGRVLSGLRTVEKAVPADAEVLVQQATEPRWDSCDGRPGTSGWSDATVTVQFRTAEQPDALGAVVDAVLTAAGWRRTGTSSSPLGPVTRWSRTLAGSIDATATLSPGTRGDGVFWDLGALAPPSGPRASGC